MNQPLPAALRIHADDLPGGFAEMQVAERRHFKAEAAQPRELLGSQAGGFPAGERGRDNGIEFGLGDNAVVDVCRGLIRPIFSGSLGHSWIG